MISQNQLETKPTNTSRRVFTKSRNGCSQCKRRKVKCDEQAPCCRNCKKRRVRCDFETSWPNSEASSSSQSDITSQTLVSTRIPHVQHQSPRFGGLSPHSSMSGCAWFEGQSNPLRDLELMHHYSTTGFVSISDRDVYQPVWQIAVPKEAQSCQFLMHAILAISSLHISHIWSSNNENEIQARSYRNIALRHCNSAVSTFRSTVTQTAPSNINAFFAFSHIMIFFAFGASNRSLKDGKMEDPIGDLLVVFNILRGSMQTIRESWNLVEESAMSLLLERGAPEPDRKCLTPDAVDALKYLEQFCELALESEEKQKQEVYQAVIQQLCESFVMAEAKRVDWGVTLRFPIIISEAFLTYLKAREPMSLVILAHYCVILHRAAARWWAVDWSAQVIEAVFESFNRDWRRAISWPLEVVCGGV